MSHLVIAVDNQDAQLGLPALDDLCIDVMITDPPYSAKVHECSRRGATGYKERKGVGAQISRSRDLEFEPMTAKERADFAWHCARLVRRWVLIFCDHESSTQWAYELEFAGLEYVRTCIWHKIGCTPQFTGDRPASAHECIVVAHQTHEDGRNKAKRWNGGGKHGVYSYPIVLDRAHNGSRLHTTQKPLALMRDLVSDFTDFEELVCDPYAGSGTTGLACAMLGRRFLGFERKSDYAEIAERRLCGLNPAPNEQQTEMFG